MVVLLSLKTKPNKLKQKLMKTVSKIATLLALALITLSSCAQSWNNKGIKGNGNVTTETVKVADYDEINAVGSMNVTLVNGTEGAIKVTTDENLQEYVDITSSGGKLSISLTKKGWLRTKKGINIQVPFMDLDNISLVGSGYVSSKANIKASQMDISVTGSGDMDLTIEAENLDGNLSGSGDIRLQGKATNFKAKVSGSGDLDARALDAQYTEAFVAGSGDLQVNAKKSIKARVNGSGDISYSGNPDKVDTKISGSGDIDAN
jgi:hypothetical protein